MGFIHVRGAYHIGMDDMERDGCVEVAIVGAGPIGLELAVGLKRAGIEYLQFDARQIGHTVSWFAPQTHFFSSSERIAIAGVPLQTLDQLKPTREQYLAYLRGVVQQFDLDVHTYEPVMGIERNGDEFELHTVGGGEARTYRAKRIVLATGGTAHPRMLGVAGEELPHVSHYFEDPHMYFNRRVLIVGGRNSAVEAAIRLHHIGAKVSLSYRGHQIDEHDIKYWLYPEMTGLIKSGRVSAYFRSVVEEITGAHVVLRHLDGGELRMVGADMVLLLIGYAADLTLCRQLGVELRGPGNVPVYDERTMQSNVPGVYLAGTVIGGTQEKYRVFLENCHVHVERIVAAVQGRLAPRREVAFAQPES